MVLYSKRVYGSQFSGEKIYLKIQYFVTNMLNKNEVFFLGDTLYLLGFFDGSTKTKDVELSPKNHLYFILLDSRPGTISNFLEIHFSPGLKMTM